MSNRYAIINSSNVVENMVVWDGNLETWKPPTGYTAVEVEDNVRCGIGMTYNSSGTGTGDSNDNMWIIPPDKIKETNVT